MNSEDVKLRELVEHHRLDFWTQSTALLANKVVAEELDQMVKRGSDMGETTNGNGTVSNGAIPSPLN